MKAENPSNSFTQLFGELGKGAALNDASKALQTLVSQCRDRLQPGELVIKLKLEPSNGGERMEITYDVAAKPPKEKKRSTLMFTTEEGLLTRQDPQQTEMTLEVIPADTRPAQPICAEASKAAVAL